MGVVGLGVNFKMQINSQSQIVTPQLPLYACYNLKAYAREA